MIIGYKGPWVLYFIYLLIRYLNKISLPNIITGKDIIPELLQGKFTVDNICYETEKLLYNQPIREKMIEQLGEVKEKLSDKFSAKEVANCILETID